jgi:hypothetical protein
MAQLPGTLKALLIPSQRPAKIQQAEPNHAVEKGPETASPRQRQLPGVIGPDGFLNPEVGLLVSVFEVPWRKPVGCRAPCEVDLEFAPIAACQLIAGCLVMCFPGQEKQNLVTRVFRI